MKMPTMVPLSLLSVAGLGGAAGRRRRRWRWGRKRDRRRLRRRHAQAGAEEPPPAEMCGKAFRDVYHLKRHKLSHSDEKPYHPYGCSHCGKSFSRPDHLNSHVRQVHSTERPFKCEACEAAFATKDRLRAHTVRHEEKVPCHVCGKMLSAAYIGDHMKVHGQGPAPRLRALQQRWGRGARALPHGGPRGPLPRCGRPCPWRRRGQPALV
ncbi:unnamed protein product, partial [Bubo scandiacus]